MEQVVLLHNPSWGKMQSERFTIGVTPGATLSAMLPHLSIDHTS